VLLLVTAVLLFFLGGRHYDVHQVLGIKQIKEGTSNKAITDSGELDTSGILGITRHPWYLATILLIWARQLDASAIFINVIFTSYLIVGTYLEEKKLVREFGEKYLIYQKRVPMLIPYKWLKSIIIRWYDPSNFITKQP
jgi:protein-S-isoprenylcysteine O-methyltransferase Ste14